MRDLVSVVLPCYNEEDCILSTIDEVHAALKKAKIRHEILVVDDGSTDNTVKLAKKRQVRILSHRKNKGVGGARKTGVRAAKGKYIVMTDVDGTYQNSQIPRLIKHLVNEKQDMVVGARTGKNVVFEWPHRYIPKLLIRTLASYLTHRWIPDLNSGLRVFKRDTALQYFYLLPDTHSWVSTITIAFLCDGLEVDFIPTDYYKRKGGHSSFTPINDTLNYIALIFRTLMYFKPLRMFVPLSTLIMLGGGIKMIYDWNVYGWIGSLDVIIFLSGVLTMLAGLLADSIVVNGRRR